jgi:hypothetical protein
VALRGATIETRGIEVLNEFQARRVWENLLAAEARSLYFADLASNYTLRKQLITAASFFLSSGAAAALVGKLPPWIPVILATVVAITNAYSMAVSLDKKISTMVKLHSAWSLISIEYDRLWNHQSEDDAEAQMERIIRQEKEPSELATTEAPNDQVRLGKWQDRVFEMYRPSGDHG